MTDAERGAEIAGRAMLLVGTRFRLHGRDPEHGLDCIGLAAAAARSGGFSGGEPTGYAMGGDHGARIAGFLRANGFRRLPRSDASLPGDLWVVRPGPRRIHLMIRVAGGFVHAHSGLRRVVMMPGPVDWPVSGIWRFTGE